MTKSSIKKHKQREKNTPKLTGNKFLNSKVICHGFDNIFFIVICLLVVMTPLLVIPQMFSGAITPKYFISQFLLSVLILIGLLKLLIYGFDSTFQKMIYFPLIGFLIFYILPSLFGKTPYLSFHQGLPVVLWITGSMVISWNCKDAQFIKRVVWAVLIGGFISAIYGLLQYFNIELFGITWMGRQLVEKQIMISTFGNANFFAAYLVPLSILCVSWMVGEEKKNYIRGTSIFLFILFFVCILLSGVRSAWLELPLALLIGLFLYYQTFQHRETNYSENKYKKIDLKIIIWLLLSLVFLIIIGILLFKNQIFNIGWFKKQILSLKNIHVLAERFLVWQIAILMILKNPLLGIGLGRFQGEFFNYLREFMQSDVNRGYEPVLAYLNGRNANHVHNDYLQLTAETGIIPFGILLFFLMVFYYSQYKMIFNIKESGLKLIHIGLLVATIPFLTNSLVNFPFYLPVNGMLFWILIGLSLGHTQNILNKEKIRNEESIKKIPSWIKYPAFILLILLFSFSIGISFSHALASYYLKQGIGTMQQLKGDRETQMMMADRAGQYLEKSISFNPASGQAHFWLGKLYGITGQLEKAIKEYQLSEKYGADDITVYEDQGKFYQLHKKYDDAIINYEIILDILPNNSGAHRQLAWIYLKHQFNPDKAIFHIEKYLAANPPEDEKKWFQNELTELKKIK